MKSKKKQILVLLGLCLMLLVGRAPTDTPYEDRILKVKSAAEHSQITITGNEELDAFCSGNSTTGLSWADAHVIENFSIDLTIERQTCFSLMDTDRCVIIKNVTLTTYKDSYCYAFYLNNVSNIKIENTTIVNSDYGIHMTNVTNFTLKESSIRADGYSIYSVSGSNLVVSEVLSDNFNTIRGFAFIDGGNITIDRCTMKTKFTGLEFTNSHSFHIQNTTFQQDTGIAIKITGEIGRAHV